MRERADCLKLGDIVCVVLGCQSPLLLRGIASSQFRVIGECSAHGLEDAVGLLGPLPTPWRFQFAFDDSGLEMCQFLNVDTGEETFEDPRLPPLPPTWERIDSERTSDHPDVFQIFKNTITGAIMNSDPRMLPDALRGRGVPLRTFQLV